MLDVKEKPKSRLTRTQIRNRNCRAWRWMLKTQVKLESDPKCQAIQSIVEVPKREAVQPSVQKMKCETIQPYVEDPKSKAIQRHIEKAKHEATQLRVENPKCTAGRSRMEKLEYKADPQPHVACTGT